MLCALTAVPALLLTMGNVSHVQLDLPAAKNVVPLENAQNAIRIITFKQKQVHVCYAPMFSMAVRHVETLLLV